MKRYLVTMRENKGDKFTLTFECNAEDQDDAETQAMNAMPWVEEVINITEIEDPK